MKKSVQSVSPVVVVLMILLSSCAPAPTPVPTSTPVPPTLTPSPIPPTFTPSPIPPTFTPEPTATSAVPNLFIGYWTQTKLSKHPLGMTICGNFQNVEFLEDGTFAVTNDYSGVYKKFDPGFGASTASGKYKVLDEKRIEIEYASDNVTEWEYTFSGNELTMSSPVPDELGGGMATCHFSKSSKWLVAPNTACT